MLLVPVPLHPPPPPYLKLDARAFQQIFCYQPQSSGRCMDIDISVFNYVSARKLLRDCKSTGLKGRNTSIKAFLVTDDDDNDDDDDDDRFKLILQSGEF
jgi:hypothetical protein